MGCSVTEKSSQRHAMQIVQMLVAVAKLYQEMNVIPKYIPFINRILFTFSFVSFFF